MATDAHDKYLPDQNQRVRVQHLQEMTDRGEKITALTAYDALTARLLDAAGIDIIHVGDSYATQMLGYPTVLPVTLEDMEEITAAVARGTTRAFIVADLPFGSYEESPQQAIASAIRLMRAGADGVNVSGGKPLAATARALADAGVNVMAHIGYAPQRDSVLGGRRIMGLTPAEADSIIDDAGELEQAGAFAVILDLIPAQLSAKITEILRIPTIGVGAGGATDGQVMKWTDMAGLTPNPPIYVHRFGEVGAAIRHAAEAYRDAVKRGQYPGPEFSF